MRAQDFPVLLVDNQLDLASGIAQSERFAVGLKGDTTNLHPVAALCGLRFSQPDACNRG